MFADNNTLSRGKVFFARLQRTFSRNAEMLHVFLTILPLLAERKYTCSWCVDVKCDHNKYCICMFVNTLRATNATSLVYRDPTSDCYQLIQQRGGGGGGGGGANALLCVRALNSD